IERQSPAVAKVTPGVDSFPADAAVAAPGRAVTSSLISAPLRGRVPRKAVRIALCPGTMVGEATARVLAVHDAAELDPDEQAVGGKGIGRDPPDVVSLGSWGKAPLILRRDLLQRFELGPGAAVPGDEKPAWFSPGVERAVRPADRHRVHVTLGKVGALPAPAAVQAQPGATASGPDQDAPAVRGYAGGRDAVQHRMGGPRMSVRFETGHAVVAGAEVGDHGDRSTLALRCGARPESPAESDEPGEVAAVGCAGTAGERQRHRLGVLVRHAPPSPWQQDQCRDEAEGAEQRGDYE